MMTRLIILGCGNSMGVPRIDGFWGKCNKNNTKNIRTRCSAIILKGSNSILIDTSPDIKSQFVKNNLKNIKSVDFVNSDISIKPIDYYFTNPIARSSKTMAECKRIKKRFLFTGIDKAS